MSVVVFSGGVGGARFLSGLRRVMDETEITVISNVGDDTIFYGLYVCPDIDIVIYTLAGRNDTVKGWGLQDDSFRTLEELKKLGHDGWFNLGDRDFATQIHRTLRLNQGWTLSQVTEELARKNGLGLRILPATDHPVPTCFETEDGTMPFQEYMVKNAWQVDIKQIRFTGTELAAPAPGVIDSILSADHIIFAPSNPFISIGSILAIPGIRQAVEQADCPVTAISPIVGGTAIKGPAARLMAEQGYEVSPVGVAQCYKGLIDRLVIDTADAHLAGRVEELGIRCGVTETMMTDNQRKEALARFVLG